MRALTNVPALLPAAGNAPDVLDELGVEGEDAPVGVDGGADRHPVVAGVLAGDEVLAAVLDPLHRTVHEAAGDDDRDLVGRA